MKKQISFITKFCLIGFVLLLARCAGDSEDDPIIIDKPEQHSIPAQIISPTNEQQYTIGESIFIKIKINNAEAVSDLELFVNDTLFASNLKAEDQTVEIPTNKNSRVGWTKILMAYKDENGKKRSDTRKVIIFSALVPGEKEAVIVNTYPHQKTSYTQGLEFYNGALFEGTGQHNQSVLAEVDLITGTKLREFALDPTIFGEGITILNDTIYQITYRAQICYMYDLDFKPIGSFTYDGEGWGLCNDGKYLLMSNGSAEIVWRDPKTFEVVRKRDVFDDQNSIGNLNELELINGNLFANLYTQNRIAEIDTATGKVLNYMNCRTLALDANEAGNDVLNGIAYNPVTGKMYMTGKWWPKLYEVSFE